MDLWDTDKEEVALLRERANEACRLAATELKEQKNSSGKRKRGGNGGGGDDRDRDDDEVEAGMPSQKKRKAKAGRRWLYYEVADHTPANTSKFAPSNADDEIVVDGYTFHAYSMVPISSSLKTR